jgi:hypothetical protein
MRRAAEKEGTKGAKAKAGRERGGGNAVLLDADGSNVDPSPLAVHEHPLVTADDGHVTNYEVKKKTIHLAHNCTKGAL